MSKPCVLVVVDYYLPGFKGGGPIASVSRMVKNLRNDFDIRIFTRDRDLGDSEPFPGIKVNAWNDVKGLPVYYASPDQLSRQALEKLITETGPELIYLNSYFSVLSRRVLLLAKLRRLKDVKFALAPRGEFSRGALSLKRARKQAFLMVASLTRLTDRVVWHVSSVHEREDVLRAIGPNCTTIIKAPDTVCIESDTDWAVVSKERGSASFAWLSRVAPIKNLLGAIEMLGEVQREATLTVYGPLQDKAYWERCKEAIAALPKNVKVVHAGGLQPDEVAEHLSQHHFFLFPTLGENFGHVIPEALSAGCPVLLSDQTPWRDLNEHAAGWVMPLDNPLAWRECVQTCIDMDNARYQAMRNSAKHYIEEYSKRQNPNGNSHLFDVALAS